MNEHSEADEHSFELLEQGNDSASCSIDEAHDANELVRRQRSIAAKKQRRSYKLSEKVLYGSNPALAIRKGVPKQRRSDFKRDLEKNKKELETTPRTLKSLPRARIATSKYTGRFPLMEAELASIIRQRYAASHGTSRQFVIDKAKVSGRKKSSLFFLFFCFCFS